MDDENSNQIISFLQSLNRELEDLKTKTLYYLRVDMIHSPQINNILELENSAPIILSPQNPIRSYLKNLKNLINNLKSYQNYSPQSFIHRRIISYQISSLVLLLQKEIQICFDKENISNLVKVLQESCDEEEKLRALRQFDDRISTGFDLELQNLILKTGLFPVLESILCHDSCSYTVREKAGFVIAAVVRFNRDVFVGNMLMGFTIPSLIQLGSSKSLEILLSLIKSVKGHLVMEMKLNGQIPTIVGFLSSEDLQVRIMAMHCVLEMVYFGTKEVIESMIDYGLVEKLVRLQRVEPECSELGQIGGITNIDMCEGVGREEDESLSNNPFIGCIARLAMEVEIGEGI
ncbi:unnamed protein product, partial [Amaranthus hypochondriacus]